MRKTCPPCSNIAWMCVYRFPLAVARGASTMKIFPYSEEGGKKEKKVAGDSAVQGGGRKVGCPTESGDTQVHL